VPELEDAREFERRFRDEADDHLTGLWLHDDPAAVPPEHRRGRTFWTWVRADEVSLRGSYPDTRLVVIGAGIHDPTCRFGFSLPVWLHGGRESWDPPGEWKPEWGGGAGRMLCYNVFEEAEWTVGVPTRLPCDPDEHGITWIALPGLG
jgi:hypothetical protein